MTRKKAIARRALAWASDPSATYVRSGKPTPKLLSAPTQAVNSSRHIFLEKRLGRPLLFRLSVVVLALFLLASTSVASAQGGAPAAPDQPTGTAVFIGGVDLEWNEVPGAESHDVQMYRGGWTDLPGDGVEIAFYGAGAIISELNPDGTSYWFHLRAKNPHGSSEWSDFNWMSPTAFFDSGERARPDNVPATGPPVIIGTARVGETLTVDTSGIADGNSLDRVEFHFQWVGNDGAADTDIVGATGASYTLQSNDAGNAIRARVSFTDRGGYAESLTSAPTDAVSTSAPVASTPEGICDRTEQVRNEILASLPSVDDCSAVTSGDLSGIIELSFNFHAPKPMDSFSSSLFQHAETIASLKAHDFHGLTNLASLDLSHQSLTELPEGVFDGLSN